MREEIIFMNLLSSIKTKFFLFLKKLSFMDFLYEPKLVIIKPINELVVREVFPFGRLGFTYTMIDFSKHLEIRERIIFSQGRTQREELKDFAMHTMSLANKTQPSVTTFRLRADFVRSVRKLSPFQFFSLFYRFSTAVNPIVSFIGVHRW
jgi:hypothetical protein